MNIRLSSFFIPKFRELILLSVAIFLFLKKKQKGFRYHQAGAVGFQNIVSNKFVNLRSNKLS